jgi:hypothetical protein
MSSDIRILLPHLMCCSGKGHLNYMISYLQRTVSGEMAKSRCHEGYLNEPPFMVLLVKRTNEAVSYE